MRDAVQGLQAHSVLVGWAAALILSGCAVGPDYSQPTPHELLPQHFSTDAVPASAPTPLPLARWWSAFADEALDELVDAALRHSPDLDSAEAAVRQARAMMGQAESADRPQLNAQSRAGQDQISRNGESFANIPFPNARARFADYQVGFDASWELDLFGHSLRTRQAALARVGSAEERSQDAALHVVAETVRNVLDTRYLQLRLTNAHAVLIDQREILRLTRLAEQAGMASRSDVEQAQIGVRNADAVLPPLRTAILAARAALGPLTSLPAQRIAELLDANRPAPVLPELPPVDGSTALLRRRPDLRAAERDLAAASANVALAVAEQYPRLALLGDTGWDAIEADRLTSAASRFWNIGPQLSLPLFAGGRLQAQVRASEFARDAALAQYRKVVLLAFADVDAALARCRGDHDRLSSIQDVELAQTRQLNFARQRVRVGESAQTDALVASVATAAIVDQRLATQQALAADLVALYKALGGSALPPTN